MQISHSLSSAKILYVVEKRSVEIDESCLRLERVKAREFSFPALSADDFTKPRLGRHRQTAVSTDSSALRHARRVAPHRLAASSATLRGSAPPGSDQVGHRTSCVKSLDRLAVSAPATGKPNACGRKAACDVCGASCSALVRSRPPPLIAPARDRALSAAVVLSCCTVERRRSASAGVSTRTVVESSPSIVPIASVDRVGGASSVDAHDSYLVDPASSHMLVSKIKPCMSKHRPLHGEAANGSLGHP